LWKRGEAHVLIIKQLSNYAYRKSYNQAFINITCEDSVTA